MVGSVVASDFISVCPLCKRTPYTPHETTVRKAKASHVIEDWSEFALGISAKV
jgi:hypothetical protein